MKYWVFFIFVFTSFNIQALVVDDWKDCKKDVYRHCKQKDHEDPSSCLSGHTGYLTTKCKTLYEKKETEKKESEQKALEEQKRKELEAQKEKEKQEAATKEDPATDSPDSSNSLGANEEPKKEEMDPY